MIPLEEVSTHDEIDKLYEERHQLEIDFDNNAAKIAEIDKKLEKLGVEEISSNTLQQKLSNSQLSTYSNNGTADINYDVQSTKTIKWTSERVEVRYNGKPYQLQIIKGVPKTTNSELMGEYHVDSKTNSGFKAGLKDTLKVEVINAATHIPKVGGKIGLAQTFYDVFKGVCSGLSKTTLVNGTKCSYTTNISVHEVYVLVKYQGSTDSDQKLCYSGNSAMYATAVAAPDPFIKNGVAQANVMTQKFTGTINAADYNDYKGKAMSNFWNFNNGKVFSPNEMMITIQEQMISGNHKISLPYSRIVIS